MGYILLCYPSLEKIDNILSEKIIHRSHGILFHKEVPSAVILLGEGGKEKVYKYTMYIYLLLWIHKRLSIYLRPSIVFVIMLFPPATKRDQTFIRDQL